jgi:hypothetical protein
VLGLHGYLGLGRKLSCFPFSCFDRGFVVGDRTYYDSYTPREQIGPETAKPASDIYSGSSSTSDIMD